MEMGAEEQRCDTNGSLPWWVIYTRYQHEKIVADTLAAYGLEAFLPLYKSLRQWKDRRKVLLLPLFPCYVFIRGGLERRFQVLSIPGVHMALSRGEQIAVIAEAEIEAIRSSLQTGRNVEPHPFLNCGERVRVKSGPLQGIEGILTRKKSVYRLVLSVEMLAKSVAVEVDVSNVEPVSASRLGTGTVQGSTSSTYGGAAIARA